MAPPKEKKAKKGSMQLLKDGFLTIKVLDNTNIYGVVFSECISNIFKEGMWQRVLTPYILFLANHDKSIVGNAITINSTIRAVVGVVAGRFLINRLGCDSCFCIAGVIGAIGIMVNVFCLQQGSLSAVFFLNAVWGVYTGLWNSCLEVAWARSIVREYREDASNARQVTNKLTTAFGPLLSLFVFYACGNNWTMPLVTNVLLLGTAFTILPVILCFRFDRIHEVRQDISLCDVEKIVFPTHNVDPRKLKRASFTPMENGPIRLSYPLKDTSKYGKLRVFTPDLRETNFILGKQFRAWFKDAGNPREADTTGVIYFMDPSRAPVRASLESYSLFLKKDGDINLTFSQLIFYLSPDVSRRSRRDSCTQESGLVRGASKLFMSKSAREFETGKDLKESLLSDSTEAIQTVEFGDKEEKKKKGKKDKVYEPNIFKANIIVTCDVLNAVASGMSLKFMDIFLIETYGMTPAGVLAVAVTQNLATASLTPWAKQTMNWVYGHGFKSAFGVVLIWAAGCFFMAILCVPDMPLYVTVASIVLMNSLFSCTKAYNRARLINALPHDRVANYMVWDSLNKANQGGITIFGAQLVQWGGYRACFMATLFILLVRLFIYFGYSLHKGIRRKKREDLQEDTPTANSQVPPASRDPLLPTVPRKPSLIEIEEAHDLEEPRSPEKPHDDDHFEHDEDADALDQFDKGDMCPGEADSELFPPHHHDAPDSNDLLVVDQDGDHEGGDLEAEEPLTPRTSGAPPRPFESLPRTRSVP